MSIWQLTLEDKTVRLDDLPADVFVRATAGHPNISWCQLYWTPWRDPEAMYDLFCEIAKHVGVAVPLRPTTVKESADLIDLLQATADGDDLPTEFGAGGIPPEADGQETTSSSGASADSTGLPT